MSLKIESLIHKLLSEKDSTFVADELMKLWTSQDCSYEDRTAISEFLIRSGFFSTLKTRILEEISNGKPINWFGALHFLSQETLPQGVQDSLYVGLLEDSMLEELLKFNSFHQHSKFQTIRHQLIQERQKRLEKELTQIKNKFKEVLKKKKPKEVEKIKSILQQKFSFDPEVSRITSDIDMTRIRNLLKRKELELLGTPPLTLEERSAVEDILNSYVDQARVHPDTAYWMSVALYQMEAYEQALQSIESAPESRGGDWLKIELLILTKKFTQALEFSFDLETKYAEDPSTIFETLYFRALAYYELDQQEKAVSSLKKIIQIHPQHMKSKLKLKEWEESL